MALSIRNRETERLARAVAREAGETITAAIQHSLEERLQRLGARRLARDLVKDIGAIGRRCAALPDLDSRTAEQILGYDDAGTTGR